MASPNLHDLIANNNKYISKIGKQIIPQESKTIEEEKQLNIITPSNTETEKQVNISKTTDTETEKQITIEKKDTTFTNKEINETSTPLPKQDIPVTNLIYNLINNSLNTISNSYLRNTISLPRKISFLETLAKNPADLLFLTKQDLLKIYNQKEIEIVDNVPKTITYNNDGYVLKLDTNGDYSKEIFDKEKNPEPPDYGNQRLTGKKKLKR